MKAIKAILFDMDGTLIDSEPNYRRSGARFLANHGISISPAEWSRFVGIGARNFLEILRQEHGLTGDEDELLDENHRLYMEEARTETRVFPEVFQLAQWARTQGIRTAVASGSTMDGILSSLELGGIHQGWDALVSATMVARGKPAPDIFLHTAALLGVEPESCLVVEDSIYGVRAGLDAGMTVLAMPYEEDHRDDPVYREAHWLVDGNADRFDCATFVAWLGKTGRLA